MQILFECFCLKASTESHTHPKKQNSCIYLCAPRTACPQYFLCVKAGDGKCSLQSQIVISLSSPNPRMGNANIIKNV